METYSIDSVTFIFDPSTNEVDVTDGPNHITVLQLHSRPTRVEFIAECEAWFAEEMTWA